MFFLDYLLEKLITFFQKMQKTPFSAHQKFALTSVSLILTKYHLTKFYN